MAPGELEEANDVPPETHANSVNGVSREFSNSFEPASVPSAAPTAPNKSPLSGQSTNKARVHPFQPEAGEDTKKTGIIAPLKVHIAASGSQLEGAVPNQSASVFDQLERRKHNSRAPWRVRVGDFMDGIPFTIVTILFTMLVSLNFFIWMFMLRFLVSCGSDCRILNSKLQLCVGADFVHGFDSSSCDDRLGR
jgi:hypothetical protein